MSTNARIAVLYPDGSINSVYLHNDGYPEWVAPMLLKHYNDQTLADWLISLGDMSSLREKIMPNRELIHHFSNSQPDVCVFYCRDRGEAWAETKGIKFTSKRELLDTAIEPYLYLYDCKQKCWKMSNPNHLVFRKINAAKYT